MTCPVRQGDVSTAISVTGTVCRRRRNGRAPKALRRRRRRDGALVKHEAHGVGRLAAIRPRDAAGSSSAQWSDTACYQRRVPVQLERAAKDRLTLQIAGSAGDVKDRLDLPSPEARDQPAGLFCWDSDKVNVSTRRLRHHLGHDRQRAVGPGADDQPGSAPRELLVGRERSVSELVAVWLRRLLAPFAHGTSVNDDVVLVRSSVDFDRPEPEESHIHLVPPYPSVRKSNTSESTPVVSWYVQSNTT